MSSCVLFLTQLGLDITESSVVGVMSRLCSFPSIGSTVSSWKHLALHLSSSATIEVVLRLANADSDKLHRQLTVSRFVGRLIQDFICMLYIYIYTWQADTSVFNPVIPIKADGGQIRLNVVNVI